MPVKRLQIRAPQQGLFEFTQQVQVVVKESHISEGLCTLFVQHTSASLLIQENADPDVRTDLNNWFKRLVPEGDRLYTHIIEGADDMPAHIKSALTATSLSIPIVNNKLALGTWQGIYLWEHRQRGGMRTVIVYLGT
jgi:secondary thiamine-phosphate synthase enzyme